MKTRILVLPLIITFLFGCQQCLAQAPVRPPSTGVPGSPSAVNAPSPTPNPIPQPPPTPVVESKVIPAATTPEPAKFVPAPDRVFWIVFGAMTLVLFAGIASLSRQLDRDRDWNLGDLMSGADGKPSASRLIAFLGFLVMTSIILGIGYSSLWVFLKTGQLPSLSGASTFLVACAGLFAPYFANQIGLAIGGTTPNPTSLAPVVIQSSSPTLQMSPTGAPGVTFGPPVKPGSVS
jgi:hypothetical protein